MHTAHAVYLGIIVVLVLIVVVIGAKAMRFSRELKFMKANDPYLSESRERPLRSKPENPTRAPSINEYMAEITTLIEKSDDNDTLKRKMSQLDMRASIILLEMARTANRERLGNDSATPPIDTAEAAVAVAYMSAGLRRHAPAMLFVALRGLCRQTACNRENAPEIPNIEKIGHKICEDFAAVVHNIVARAPEKSETSMDTVKLYARVYEFAAVAGWMFAGGQIDAIPEIRRLGGYVGCAFTLMYDIAGVDPLNGAVVKDIGADAAIDEVRKHTNAAKIVLKNLDLSTAVWDEIFAQLEPLVQPSNFHVPSSVSP